MLPPYGDGFRGISLAYNARTRADVDSLLEEAAAAGAKIVKPAQEAFWGGYSGYFSDPDGFSVGGRRGIHSSPSPKMEAFRFLNEYSFVSDCSWRNAFASPLPSRLHCKCRR